MNRALDAIAQEARQWALMEAEAWAMNALLDGDPNVGAIWGAFERGASLAARAIADLQHVIYPISDEKLFDMADLYWNKDDGEEGFPGIYEATDDCPLGEIVTLQCGFIGATRYCVAIPMLSDPESADVEHFATLAEAEAAYAKRSAELIEIENAGYMALNEANKDQPDGY